MIAKVCATVQYCIAALDVLKNLILEVLTDLNCIDIHNFKNIDVLQNYTRLDK
jgi:hypothetical protein